MNELKLFEKEEFGKVRVIMRDGEPWFVAKDVAKALGYTNPGHAVQRHCEKVNKITQQSETGISANTLPINLLIIPEEDVYALIFGSELPSAKAFKRWICDEVLPSIRRTGGYGQWNLPRVPQSFPDALRMIADIEEEKQLAIEQRDYYKRTKAEIGSRREATSMATASAAVRRADRLEDELGVGKHYKQVKAIPWLLDVFEESAGMYSQVGRKLSDLSARMDIPPRLIEDARYGTLKAYHVDVVEAFRLELAKDRNMLGKYRWSKAA